jgi:hypothetical protein
MKERQICPGSPFAEEKMPAMVDRINSLYRAFFSDRCFGLKPAIDRFSPYVRCADEAAIRVSLSSRRLPPVRYPAKKLNGM